MYRVALVCEGPSDRAILDAILLAHLGDYVLQPIQPPLCDVGGDSGPLGGGWKGVRAWCRQEASIGGGVLGALQDNADFVVVQVDADVAQELDSGIVLEEGARCPPPSALSDPVRSAVCSWLGVPRPPRGLVLCVPAMATETWALVALHPEALSPSGTSLEDGGCIECNPVIKDELRRLGRSRKPRLVTRQDGRLKNDARGYRVAGPEITAGWPTVVARCSEAARFDRNLHDQRKA